MTTATVRAAIFTCTPIGVQFLIGRLLRASQQGVGRHRRIDCNDRHCHNYGRHGIEKQRIADFALANRQFLQCDSSVDARVAVGAPDRRRRRPSVISPGAILEELSTIVRNTCRVPNTAPTFPMLTIPMISSSAPVT
jgi:hypothetical protein